MDTAEKQTIYQMFRLSVWLKGIVSFGEIVAGILALVVPLSIVRNALAAVSNGSLGERLGNIVAPYLQEAISFLSAGTALIAFYLISRGLIKLLLIIALLRNKLWAYPSSLVVLGGFVVYQLYEFFLTHSVLLVGLSIFDLVVMYFIWQEYRIVKRLVA